jgi:hypothetical protein
MVITILKLPVGSFAFLHCRSGAELPNLSETPANFREFRIGMKLTIRYLHMVEATSLHREHQIESESIRHIDSIAPNPNAGARAGSHLGDTKELMRLAIKTLPCSRCLLNQP